MPLASWSSICAIWAATSDSVGGASTTTSTPSALPFSSAPRCTAAQNGLPAPGPFMSTTTDCAAAMVLAVATNPAASAASMPVIVLMMIPSSLLLRLVPGLTLPLFPRSHLSPYDVEEDREHDDGADQDLLPEHADVVEVQAVADQAHDDDPAEHAQHRAAAAEEAGAADDHGRERLQLGADAGIGEAGVGPPGHDQSGEARHQPAQRVDDDQHAVDVDAADPRRLRVAPDRIDAPPQHCML